jgi:AraC-like DNA-binding protein
MEYSGAVLPNLISVDEIMSVHDFDFSRIANPVRGESHNFPELLYIYEGQHEVVVNGHLCTLEAGDMIMYAPMSFHSGTGEGKLSSKGLIISFRCSFEPIEDIYDRVITVSEKNGQRITELLTEAIPMFMRFSGSFGKREMRLREEVDIYQAEIIKKKLEIFLLSVYSENKPKRKNISGRHQKNVMAIVDFLKDNLKENLTLEEIAVKNAMSVSKLKTVFRECFSCGPVAYFNNMKIEEAKRLIREGKHNISQIASALQFDTPQYFSICFRRYARMSPQEYKRSIL